MNETVEELQQLAADYVLGTLPLERRRAVVLRLADDAALRAAVDDWERRLLPLTALAPPQQPSAGLWPRIAASVQQRAAQAAPPRGAVGLLAPWRRWWDDLRLWRGLAGLGVAAAVVLGVLVLHPVATAPAYMVVLMAPQERTAGWVVQASLDRRLTLTPLHGTAVPDHKALQFWTKGQGWNGPVSLGLVQPDRARTLALGGLPPLQSDQLFEITLEPQAGSPTGKPSGPVLYIGRAVKVM